MSLVTLLERNSHHGVLIHHQLKEDLPIVVRRDPTQEVKHIFLLILFAIVFIASVLLVVAVVGSAEIVILTFYSIRDA